MNRLEILLSSKRMKRKNREPEPGQAQDESKRKNREPPGRYQDACAL
uniref:Uncharacterized protein n=1 Tax=Picea glauca TaxID=3330 RepID=A0A117NHL5_PICGL|nr:hypothetical protein ABT39_MTgene4530 [Picea glauca]